MSFLVSLAILSLLIFIHELGHFLFARLFGVRVEVFSIGFGSTLLRKIHKGTEYRLSMIPLGGYVKMKGQDDLDPTAKNSDGDSYNSKPPLQRIAILSGGVLFNFIFAFIMFFSIGSMGFSTLSSKVGTLQEGMPGVESGLQEGDIVKSINGEKIVSWRELAKTISESRDDSLLFVIERNSSLLNIVISPKISESKNIFGETIYKRMVGIAPSNDMVEVEYTLLEALQYGVTETLSSMLIIFQSVEKLIVGVLSLDQLGGVVSIFEYTAKASETGITTLLFMTALLSVNLGVLNLLPIPALDGGHIIFVLYEMVTGRVANEKIMYQLTIMGWIILASLMVIGLYNDINRLISG